MVQKIGWNIYNEFITSLYLSKSVYIIFQIKWSVSEFLIIIKMKNIQKYTFIIETYIHPEYNLMA